MKLDHMLPQFTARSWRLFRWGYGLIWLICVGLILTMEPGQPVPTGIANYIDLSFMARLPIAVGIMVLAVIILVLYIQEKAMRFVTLGMMVLALLSQTLFDSQGAFGRNEILSLVAMGQFFAYWGYPWLQKHFPQHQASDWAVIFARQGMVGAYLLAGVTKLEVSGLAWISDSTNAIVQIAKSFYQVYYTIDAPYMLDFVKDYTSFWLDHPLLLIALMTGGLFLELFSPLALLSNRSARWFGVAMLLFHLGILFVMGVLFIHYLILLVVVFIIPRIRSGAQVKQ